MATIIRDATEPNGKALPQHYQSPNGKWFILNEIRGVGGEMMLSNSARYTDLSEEEIRNLGYDAWIEMWEDVFKYYFVYPKDRQDGIRDLVRSINEGKLLETWNEEYYLNENDEEMVLSSVKLKISQARSLESTQNAIIKLSSLPDGIYWYQRINENLSEYSGLEKFSKYPEGRSEDVYLTGELYQTNDIKVSSQRGTGWSKEDVLNRHNLTNA